MITLSPGVPEDCENPTEVTEEYLYEGNTAIAFSSDVFV
jgi:hypothetical protein